MVTLIVGAVCLVVGGGLGYAFRGKEHAALASVGKGAASIAGQVAQSAQDVQKKV